MVGDIANKWVLMGIPAMSAYKAVAERFGKQTTSIRNYAYISRRFSPERREEYGILRYDHFRYAYQCDNPLEVLNYAVQVADERGGRPASVDELRAVFKGARRLIIDDEDLSGTYQFSGPGWAIPISRRLLLLDKEKDWHIIEEAEKLIKQLINLLEDK